MSRSGFFNKVPGQSIFRGQQVDLLSWLCLLDAYCCHFLHFFYIIVSYLRGHCAMAPLLQKPCEKQREIQVEDLFF